MGILALKLVLAPGLVAAASLCLQRFGPLVGGAVGGLPVVAGPILLVLSVTHGRHFGAESARSALLGLVSLTVFVVSYSWLCQRASWRLTLPVSWSAFLISTAVMNAVSVGTIAALICSSLGVSAALVVLPGSNQELCPISIGRSDLPVRALAAAIMVLVLTAVSSSLGAHLSGLLAPFPIATSVLAGFTHGQRGADETRALLRGMLMGFFAFGLFCATFATALPTMGAPAAFAIASVLALALQAAVLGRKGRRTAKTIPRAAEGHSALSESR